MSVIVENSEENALDSRLQAIRSILVTGRIDRREVITHEIDDDLFVKDFIDRNQQVMPESGFVLSRLKKAVFAINE